MEPDSSNWQEEWERQATQAANVFSAWTDEQLLDWVTRRGTDAYYTVWEEIGRRRNPALFEGPLTRIVSDESVSSLVRSHAALALERTLDKEK